VKWCETFEALHQIGYNDELVVEAFGLALPEIAAATKSGGGCTRARNSSAATPWRSLKANVAKRWKC